MPAENQPSHTPAEVRDGVRRCCKTPPRATNDPITLTNLNAVPITVRTCINSKFFLPPWTGLSSSQVRATSTQGALIMVTMDKLEEQGRLDV